MYYSRQQENARTSRFSASLLQSSQSFTAGVSMGTDSGYRMLIDAIKRVKLEDVRHVVITEAEQTANGGICKLALERGIVWDLYATGRGVIMKPRQPYDMFMDQDNAVHIRQWQF